MTTYSAPICMYCRRLHALDPRRAGMRCDAYPRGIPLDIIRSRADHRQRLPGDHGRRFLATSDEARAHAEDIIAEAQRVRDYWDAYASRQ